MDSRPVIAITMGDPAGIGSEIIVKALSRAEVYEACVPVVVGDLCAMEDAVRFCGAGLRLNRMEAGKEIQGKFGVIDCLDMGLLLPGGWEYGRNSAQCGEASFQYILKAIELALKKEAEAVITAPINKKSLHLAGHPYSGHTEIFAEYTGTRDYAMLLACGNLRVIHVTTHCALREACNLISKRRVLQVIKLAAEGTRQLGVDNPRIAVAGLNPHASEDGLFGCEEKNEIIPAIQEARKLGLNVFGPESPDTVFVSCLGGKFDIVVAMYHDQGHIPLKLMGFRLDPATKQYAAMNGINCTVGLPVVRVSVDHGTAYGKAGKGLANEGSMLDAIFAGVRMAKSRKSGISFLENISRGSE